MKTHRTPTRAATTSPSRAAILLAWSLAALVALLPSCGSSSDLTARQTSAVLTCPSYGSVSLPAPLPDGPTPGFGAAGGTFGVDPSGNAEYAVSLAVPPGPPGMTPSLGVTYRGGSGTGYAGTGVAITGLSSITRCGKTMAHDFVMDAVHYTGSDNYCLDGQLLRKVADLGTTVEYRTFPDTFVKVIGTKGPGNDANGHSYFTVIGKDGTYYDYGSLRDDSSRVYVSKIDTNGSNVVGTWLLSRRYSPATQASIFYQYSNIRTGGGYTYAYAPLSISYAGRTIAFTYGAGQTLDNRAVYHAGMLYHNALLLSSITTSTTAGTIDHTYWFIYNTGPRSGRILLTDINESTAASGSARSIVHFDYFDANAKNPVFTPFPTALPKLQTPDKATVLAADVSGDGLDDVVIDDGPTWSSSLATSEPPASAYAGPKTLTEADGTPVTGRSTSLDYDQDGLDDHLSYDADDLHKTWQILETRYDASNTATLQRVDTGIPRYYTSHHDSLVTPLASAHLADLNGDGAADLVQCHATGTQYTYQFVWEVFYWGAAASSTGGPGFSTTSQTIGGSGVSLVSIPCGAPIYPVDVDGDRRVDLIVPNVLEFDGNGVITVFGGNFVAVKADANQNFGYQALSLPILGVGQVAFADVNGDGLLDAIENNNATNNNSLPTNLRIFLNTGLDFLAPVDLIQPAPPAGQTLRDELPMAIAIDYNADGRQDLLLPMAVLGQPYAWVVLTATGSPSQPLRITPGLVSAPVDFAADTTGNVDRSDAYAPRVTDVDGDGAPDVLLYTNEGGFTVFHNNLAKEDALRAVTTGTNARSASDPLFVADVSFDYGNLVDWAVTQAGGPSVDETAVPFETLPYLSRWGATYANGCKYPRHCSVGPRRVVSSYVVNNGQDARRTFVLRYRDGRSESGGRGWLGFGARITEDDDTGASVLDSYDNATTVYGFADYPGAGRLISRRRWVPAFGTDPDPARIDVRVDTTPFAYYVVQHGTGLPTYFAPAASKTSQTFQGDFAPGGAQSMLQWVLSLNDSSPQLLSSTTAHYSQYDSFGNLLQSDEATSGVDFVTKTSRTFSNDPNSWIIGRLTQDQTCSAAAGKTQCITTNTTLDSLGRVQQQLVGSDDGAYTLRLETFAYDAFNNVNATSAIDEFGNTSGTCTTFDPQGVFPYAAMDGLGHTTYTAYDARSGSQTTVRDPNGLVTQRAYDGYGRLSKEVRPDGSTTTKTLTQVNDPAHGLLVQAETSTFGYGDEIDVFDEDGRVTSQSWPLPTPYCTTSPCPPVARSIRYMRYEPLHGALYQISAPVASSTPVGSVTLWQTVTRDAAGRWISRQEPSGSTTTYAFSGPTVTISEPGNVSKTVTVDARGRTVSAQEASGATTSFFYGPFEHVTTVTSAGVTTSYQPDAFGHALVVDDPDSGHTTATFDGFGRLRSQTDANGRTMSRTYDALGRVLQQTHSEGLTAWNWDSASYGIGKLASVTTSATATAQATTEAYQYSPAGQLNAQTTTIGSESFASYFYYDGVGHLWAIVYPATPGFSQPVVVVRSFDSVGDVNHISEWSTGTSVWSLTQADVEGHLTGETFGNGVSASRSYYLDRDRLHTLGATVGSTTLQSLSYVWDQRQNLQSRTDALQGITESFLYDSSDRVKCAGFSDGPACALGLVYDPNGNITSKSDVGGYTYDPVHPHAVHSAGSATYGYDPVGNQTSRPDGTITYTWANKPMVVTAPTGTTTYTYDGLLQRVRRDTGTRSTISIGGLYERSTDSNGVATHSFSIANSERTVAIFSRTSTLSQSVTYVLSDHLGSPDVLTDSSGNVVERRSYDAFGKRRSPTWGAPFTPTTSTLPTGYTDQEDDVLGLVDMKGRTYDPTLGRFLQADPVIPYSLSAQSWNAYAYVRNNPLRRTDPSGFDDGDPPVVTGTAPVDPPPPPPSGAPSGSAQGVGTADDTPGFDDGPPSDDPTVGVDAGGNPICIDPGIQGGAEDSSTPSPNDTAADGTGCAIPPALQAGVLTVSGTASVGTSILDSIQASGDWLADRPIPDWGDVNRSILKFSASAQYWLDHAVTMAPSAQGREDFGIESAFIPGMGVGVEEKFLAEETISLAEQRAIFSELREAEAVSQEAGVLRLTGVQANRAAGNAFRDEIAQLLEKEGREVQTEVYKRTPLGKRFIDIEVYQDGKLLGGIETKLGGSRYTPSQRAKDAWLWLTEGYRVTVVRGP